MSGSNNVIYVIVRIDSVQREFLFIDMEEEQIRKWIKSEYPGEKYQIDFQALNYFKNKHIVIREDITI